MGQRASEIRGLGADLIGVAVSPTFAQQAFAASLGLDFALLSDWDRTVCSDYGVKYVEWKGHAGVAKRALFVIARDGLVRYRWVVDDAMVLPDLDEVVGALRKL